MAGCKTIKEEIKSITDYLGRRSAEEAKSDVTYLAGMGFILNELGETSGFALWDAAWKFNKCLETTNSIHECMNYQEYVDLHNANRDLKCRLSAIGPTHEGRKP